MRDPRTAYTAMGRSGDLLGLLPYFHWLNAHSQRPVIITSKQYGDVLKHASYVDVDYLALPFEDCVKALAYAKQKYRHALDCSVYGWGLHYQRRCNHFGEEAWMRAGGRQALDLFRISNGGKIVLDGFDISYHEALCAEHIGNETRPVVLYNLTGNSSPLPNSDGWRQQIHARLGPHAKLIDVGQLKLRNVADLLALYRKADLLISLDTSTIHLAGACDIPYVALRNDLFGGDLWYRAHCRGQCLLQVNYSEAPRRMEEIFTTSIKQLEKGQRKLAQTA